MVKRWTIEPGRARGFEGELDEGGAAADEGIEFASEFPAYDGGELRHDGEGWGRRGNRDNPSLPVLEISPYIVTAEQESCQLTECALGVPP